MIGIIILTVVALIISVILVILEDKLNKQDKEFDTIRKLLPGYNCGACGYGSCDGMAKAILDDKEAYKKCKPLHGENKEELEKYLRNHE